MSFTPDEFTKFGNVRGTTLGQAGSNGTTNLDFEAIGNLSTPQFRQFRRDLSTDQQNLLFNNKQYIDAYGAY